MNVKKIYLVSSFQVHVYLEYNLMETLLCIIYKPAIYKTVGIILFKKRV